MLKKIVYSSLLVGFFASQFSGAVWAESHSVKSSRVYQAYLTAAAKGDFSRLEQLKSIASVDVVNEKGDTALCTAIKTKNVTAYNALIAIGADKDHACIDALSDRQKKSFCENKGITDNSLCRRIPVEAGMSTTNIAMNTAGAVLLTGGAVAAIAGGGGGGGGSSGDGENGGEGGGENPPPPPPVDACAGIECGEHGSCSDGVCVCQDGYSGTNCDVPPTGGEDPDDPDGPIDSEITIEDCEAGTYFDGEKCVFCAENQYSGPASDTCQACPEGSKSSAGSAACTACLMGETCHCQTGYVWNPAVGTCMENMAKNDCLGGRKIETGAGIQCICDDGYKLVEGTCVKPVGDDFNTGDSKNETTIDLSDSSSGTVLTTLAVTAAPEIRYGMVAELGGSAENTSSGVIVGTSDTEMVGMLANGVGVREDSGVYTPATAANKGEISLTEETSAGQGVTGMLASAGATIYNAGNIELTTKSVSDSYGMRAVGYWENGSNPVDTGYDLINDGTITLNAQEKTKDLYGMYALKRDIVNNGLIQTFFSNLDTVNTVVGNVVGMFSNQELVNNGAITLVRTDSGTDANLNFNAMQVSQDAILTNKGYVKDEVTGKEQGLISLDVKGMPYFVRGMYGEKANNTLLNEGKIQITGSAMTKGVTGDFGGIYAMSAGQGGSVTNKGMIYLGTTVYDDNKQSWVMNTFDETSGTYIPVRDSLKLTGDYAFMTAMHGEVNTTLDNQGRIVLDLEPGQSNLALSSYIMRNNTGSITNSGLIAVNLSSDTVKEVFGSSILSIMRTNLGKTLGNKGTIRIDTDVSNLNIDVFSSNGKLVADNYEGGRIDVNTKGDGVWIDVFGISGEARNDGEISIVQDGAYGVIKAVGGGQGETGTTTITLKNGEETTITGFESGFGYNKGLITINMDGDSSADYAKAMSGTEINNLNNITIKSTNKTSKSYFGTMVGMDLAYSSDTGKELIKSSNGTIGNKKESSIIAIDMKGSGLIYGVDVVSAGYSKDSRNNDFYNTGIIDIKLDADEKDTTTNVIGIRNSMDFSSLTLDPVNPSAFVVNSDFRIGRVINDGTISINAQNVSAGQGIYVETGLDGVSRYLPYDIAGMVTNGVAVNNGTIRIITSDETGNATGSARSVGILAYDGGVGINNGEIYFTGKEGSFVGLYGTGYRDMTYVNGSDIHHATKRERQYATVYNNGAIYINDKTFDGKASGKNESDAVYGDNNAILSDAYDKLNDKYIPTSWTESYKVDSDGLETDKNNPSAPKEPLANIQGGKTDVENRGAYVQTDMTEIGLGGTGTIVLDSTTASVGTDGIVKTYKTIPLNNWIFNGTEKKPVQWDIATTLGTGTIDVTNLNGTTTKLPFDAIGFATNGYALNKGHMVINATGNGRVAGLVAYDGGVVENKGTITIIGENRNNVTALYATGYRDIHLMDTVNVDESTTQDIVVAEIRQHSTMHNSGVIQLKEKLEDKDPEIVRSGDKAYIDYANDGDVMNAGGGLIHDTKGAYNMDAFGYVYKKDQNGYVDYENPQKVSSSLSSVTDNDKIAPNNNKLESTVVSDTTLSVPVTVLNQGVNYVSETGGVFAAEGTQVVGDVLGGVTLVQGTNEDKYVSVGRGEGAVIGNGDTSRLGIGSMSAMFTADWAKNTSNENGMDIVMTRRNFNELTDNGSLAQFLENNYALANNTEFFDVLKGAETVHAFQNTLGGMTGLDNFNRFASEDLTVMREMNLAMNKTMFANNESALFETQGQVSQFAFRNNKSSNASFALANKRISPRVKVGYAMSVSNLRTDDDHNNSRTNTMYQVAMPISYMQGGVQLITTPAVGFARGHYGRTGYDNTNYNGYIEKRTVSLMNEARYPISVAGFELAPTIEFNAIAYNQKGGEDNKAYSLTVESDNNLSIEAGIGLYATKDFGLGHDSRFNLNAGVMMYREFADPYNIKLGMQGMEGTFNLFDDKQRDYRGVATFGFDYTVGNMDIYGAVQHYMETENHTNIKTGLKYAF